MTLMPGMRLKDVSRVMILAIIFVGPTGFLRKAVVFHRERSDLPVFFPEFDQALDQPDRVQAFAETPGNEELLKLSSAGAQTPRLVCTPEHYHSIPALGFWSLPDRSTPGRGNWWQAIISPFLRICEIVA